MDKHRNKDLDGIEEFIRGRLIDFCPSDERFAYVLAQLAARRIEGMALTAGMHSCDATDHCQSPIEELFFMAYVGLISESQTSSYGGCACHRLPSPLKDGFGGSRGRENLFDDDAHLLELAEPDIPKWDDLGQLDLFVPQYRYKGYRADFAVRRFIWLRGLEGPMVMPLASPKVIVECDGHDFHERTKEQARHDKERDRLFQMDGFCVLRFTGSEIHNDPLGCATQVDAFLDGHMSKLVGDALNAAKAHGVNP